MKYWPFLKWMLKVQDLRSAQKKRMRSNNFRRFSIGTSQFLKWNTDRENCKKNWKNSWTWREKNKLQPVHSNFDLCLNNKYLGVTKKLIEFCKCSYWTYSKNDDTQSFCTKVSTDLRSNFSTLALLRRCEVENKSPRGLQVSPVRKDRNCSEYRYIRVIA